jgi:hypothetical protein
VFPLKVSLTECPVTEIPREFLETETQMGCLDSVNLKVSLRKVNRMELLRLDFPKAFPRWGFHSE